MNEICERKRECAMTLEYSRALNAAFCNASCLARLAIICLCSICLKLITFSIYPKSRISCSNLSILSHPCPAPYPTWLFPLNQSQSAAPPYYLLETKEQEKATLSQAPTARKQHVIYLYTSHGSAEVRALLYQESGLDVEDFFDQGIDLSFSCLLP